MKLFPGNKDGRPTVHPVDDPVKDAEAQTGLPFAVRKIWNSWEPYMQFCVTSGTFSGKKFRRHCGPVAVTNAVMTLMAADDAKNTAGCTEENRVGDADRGTCGNGEKKKDLTYTEDVFLTVADVGRRRGIYWNMDLFHHFGGTQDLRAGEYLRVCFRRFGLRARVIYRQPLNDESFMDAFRRGSLLYLELRHHPLYGNHHLIGYGVTELVSTAPARKPVRRRYLIVADGWSSHVRYLDMKKLGFCHFLEIRTA